MTQDPKKIIAERFRENPNDVFDSWLAAIVEQVKYMLDWMEDDPVLMDRLTGMRFETMGEVMETVLRMVAAITAEDASRN